MLEFVPINGFAGELLGNGFEDFHTGSNHELTRILPLCGKLQTWEQTGCPSGSGNTTKWFTNRRQKRKRANLSNRSGCPTLLSSPARARDDPNLSERDREFRSRTRRTRPRRKFWRARSPR